MSMIYFRFGSPPERPPAAVIVGAAICLALIGVGLYFLFTTPYLPHWPIVGGEAVYLVIAYLVHPHADTGDLGWLGGLIDNPFSFSDGANRFLLTWRILLFPGRVIAELVVGMVVLPFRRTAGGEVELGEELLAAPQDEPRFPPR